MQKRAHVHTAVAGTRIWDVPLTQSSIIAVREPEQVWTLSFGTTSRLLKSARAPFGQVGQGPGAPLHPAWERQTPGSSGRPASLRSTSTDTSLEQAGLLMVAITHGDAFPQLQTRPCKGGCALDDAQSCEKHPTQQPRESDAAAI